MDTARPDPLDGLHLALLQRRRDQLAARAAGRSMGAHEWIMVAIAIIGIGLVVAAASRRTERLQGFLVGGTLVVQAVSLWFLARSTARKQLEQVERQISAEDGREDAAIISEAAKAARELLL
jgi:hypothetical protein